MYLGLCVFGGLCRLVVLMGLCWVLGNIYVQSATRAGGRMLWFLWCSARRAYVGFTSRVVVLQVIGCAVPVLWWCLPLLVVPLYILTAGNGARAHGARAKASAQSFFLSVCCRYREQTDSQYSQPRRKGTEPICKLKQPHDAVSMLCAVIYHLGTRSSC